MAASGGGRVRVLEIFGIFTALSLIGLYVKKRFFDTNKVEDDVKPSRMSPETEQASRNLHDKEEEEASHNLCGSEAFSHQDLEDDCSINQSAGVEMQALCQMPRTQVDSKVERQGTKQHISAETPQTSHQEHLDPQFSLKACDIEIRNPESCVGPSMPSETDAVALKSVILSDTSAPEPKLQESCTSVFPAVRECGMVDAEKLECPSVTVQKSDVAREMKLPVLSDSECQQKGKSSQFVPTINDPNLYAFTELQVPDLAEEVCAETDVFTNDAFVSKGASACSSSCDTSSHSFPLSCLPPQNPSCSTPCMWSSSVNTKPLLTPPPSSPHRRTNREKQRYSGNHSPCMRKKPLESQTQIGENPWQFGDNTGERSTSEAFSSKEYVGSAALGLSSDTMHAFPNHPPSNTASSCPPSTNQTSSLAAELAKPKSMKELLENPKLPECVLERAPLIEDDDDDDCNPVSRVHAALDTKPSNDNPISVDEQHTADLELPPPKSASTEVISTVQEATTGTLNPQQAQVLVDALGTDDMLLLSKVLITIGNAAAFTESQNVLRDAGCLARLIRLQRAHSMAWRLNNGNAHAQRTPSATVLNGINTAVANLAVNEENQKQLQECIASLIVLCKDKSVQLSSLQALTNLSVTDKYHPPYTPLIETLYELLDDSDNPAAQLQSLKILVNLSTNHKMVGHLMAAKAPACAISLLKATTEPALLFRWLTVLANILETARHEGLTSASLPTEHKAASPETLYAVLYGLSAVGRIKSAAFVLSKHAEQQVRHQATRVYSLLT